ncbi:cytochrome C oxidase subunit II [Gracilibacillus saliphilus]|uniref:cytochrome C oxidase subunit II n=1 Tax=Gracilibacillus saliphilus TaxID=543890 RepID=UPI0013D814F3|nr:cytochrome C oxidase subunit II [Gracilibacillus saliphilus]
MKKILLGMMTLSLALVLAACGGGDDEGSSNSDGEAGENASGDGETVDIQASNWQFDQEEYTVPAGEVTVNLTNEEGFHGIEIEGTDIALDDAGSQTATLEPGEYTIRCSIMCGAGHDDMVATLIVE